MKERGEKGERGNGEKVKRSKQLDFTFSPLTHLPSSPFFLSAPSAAAVVRSGSSG